MNMDNRPPEQLVFDREGVIGDLLETGESTHVADVQCSSPAGGK